MKYPEIKLGEVADIKGGKRLPKGDLLVDFDTGFPYIRAQDIKNGLITFKEPKFITSDLRQKLKNYTVNKHDVCITIVGAYVGDVGIVPNHLSGANLTENAVKLTNLKNNFNSQYLKYALLSREAQEAMKKFGSGAAQDKLGIYKIKEIQIPNPPPEIQRKIAGILSAYDRLIENNTRRIEILEEMARSIYREWFVKFRFPGHEQVQMVNSELGLIPEGWEVISLGQLLDIKHGYAFKGEYFSKEPTSDILLTPGNFKFGGGFKDDKLKYYDGSVPKEFVLNPGDLLVTMTDLSKEGDTLGYPAFVPPSKELRFLHNQRLGKISLHNPKLGFNHLYHIFCSDSYRHHVLASATGSTVKHTAPDRIKSFSIALPTQEICKRFEMITSSLTRKIVLLNQKNANLRLTRDLLLPRLISGEIDVENLDINTGEIAA